MNDKIFPLVDRRTPLLDRIRENNESGTVGEQLGVVVGTLTQTDDEEYISQFEQTLRINFRSELADQYGVEEEQISNEFVDSIVDSLVNVSIDDVAVEGQKVLDSLDDDEDSSDDNDEDESDSVNFSS